MLTKRSLPSALRAHPGDRASRGRTALNFVVGLGAAVPLAGSGIVSATSLASVAAVGHSGGIRALRTVRTPLVLCVVGAASYLMAAAINDVNVSARGLFLLLSLAVYIAGFAALSRTSSQPFIALLVGISTGWMLYAILIGTEITKLSAATLWKYGIATPATVAIVCVLVALKWNKATVGSVLAMIGLFSLTQNFRSHAIVCLLAAALTLATDRKRFFARSKVVTVLIFALVAMPLLLVPNLIEQGAFGEDIQQKTASQTEDSGPLLFAGRTEPPLSFAVISAQPLSGWGNAQNVPAEVILQGLQYTANLGMTNQDQLLRGWLRGDAGPNLHSTIFHAWAEGGVVAALFFAWLIGMAVRALFISHGALRPLVVLLSFQIIWDTVFSPISASMLPLWAAAAVALSSSQLLIQKQQKPEIDVLQAGRKTDRKVSPA